MVRGERFGTRRAAPLRVDALWVSLSGGKAIPKRQGCVHNSVCGCVVMARCGAAVIVMI